MPSTEGGSSELRLPAGARRDTLLIRSEKAVTQADRTREFLGLHPEECDCKVYCGAGTAAYVGDRYGQLLACDLVSGVDLLL
jgi:hypothetical protein